MEEEFLSMMEGLVSNGKLSYLIIRKINKRGKFRENHEIFKST